MVNKKIFWFHLEREEDKEGINGVILKNILTSMNSLFAIIAQAKGLVNDTYPMEKFQAYIFTKIRDGCDAVGVFIPDIDILPQKNLFSFVQQKNEDKEEDPIEIVESTLATIIKNSDDDTSVKDLRENFESKDRNKMIQSLIGLCPQFGAEYNVTYNEPEEDWQKSEFSSKFDKNKRQIFKQWEKLEMINQVPYITGISDGFRIKTGNFYIKDLFNEETIICKLNDDIEEYFFPLSKNMIYRVYGDYEKSPTKSARVTNVSDIVLVGNLEVYFYLVEKYQEEYMEIKNLTPGWDGPNSTSYDEDILDNSLIFLSKFLHETRVKTDIRLPLPNMYPGSNGGIQFEFDEDKFYLHILMRKDEDDTIEIVGRSEIDPELRYYDKLKRFTIKDTFFKWITEVMKK